MERRLPKAVAQAQQYIAQEYGWVIDFDLDKFLDPLNQDKLMGQIARCVENKRPLKNAKINFLGVKGTSNNWPTAKEAC